MISLLTAATNSKAIFTAKAAVMAMAKAAVLSMVAVMVWAKASVTTSTTMAKLQLFTLWSFLEDLRLIAVAGASAAATSMY